MLAPSRPEDELKVEVVRRDNVSRHFLAAADAAAALVALTVTASLLGVVSPKPGALVLIPVVLLLNKLLGLYDRERNVLRHSTLEDVPKLVESALLAGMLAWVAESVALRSDPGKLGIIALMGVLAASLVLWRSGARVALRLALPAERCLIVGDAGVSEQIRLKLGRDHASHAELVGRLPVRDLNGAPPGETPVLGELDELEQIVPREQVDRVIVAPDGGDPALTLDIVRRARALGVRVSVLPRLFEAIGSSAEFDDLEGLVILGMRGYGLSRSSRVLKRTMDLAAATVGLLALAPLMVLTAVAIRLGSPGPALFRQRRIGRQGREFRMLKFRTMYDGADDDKSALLGLNEADGFFKIARDPRVTPVGGLLRRTCLDELPQLVNVLLGEMSLVGPRPLVPDEDRQVEGSHPRRLHLTPGITGMWQIYGSSRVPMREMVKIDYLYGANWSLWLDVKIILRTLAYVASRRGL